MKGTFNFLVFILGLLAPSHQLHAHGCDHSFSDTEPAKIESIHTFKNPKSSLSLPKELSVLSYNTGALTKKLRGRINKIKKLGAFDRKKNLEELLGPSEMEDLKRINGLLTVKKIDLIFLQEAPPLWLVEKINREYLDGRYRLIFARKSSGLRTDSSIFLIKKKIGDNLRLKVMNAKIPGIPLTQKKYLTRNLVSLDILDKDTDRPILTFYGVHLKSQRRAKSQHPEAQRLRELKFLIKDIEAEEKMSGIRPTVILGDFNVEVGGSREGSLLDKQTFVDVHSLTRFPLPLESRATFVLYGKKRNGRLVKKRVQIDAILLKDDEQRIMEVLESDVLDCNGGSARQGDQLLPISYSERRKTVSDHQPVYARFRIKR